MNPVSSLRARTGLSQSTLAARAGTSQPTIAAYEADRKSPTYRTIERLACACDLEAHVVYVSPMTREDRRSLYLHAAISRRITEYPDAALRRARQNLQTMAKANRAASPLLREWRRILDAGVERVQSVLADPGEQARDLRQVTPFAGMLTAGERQEAIRSFRRAESTTA